MNVFPISSLMMPVNLIQYKGTVEMFNNRRFLSSSLNYSYFSKKYYNDDTFTLAIGLIMLAFYHLIYVLSNWIFISRFLPDLVSICNFSRKILYLIMIVVYVHHIWLSHYYQAKWWHWRKPWSWMQLKPIIFYLSLES